MTSDNLKYIAACAAQYENGSVSRLSCADVRQLLRERADLLAALEEIQKGEGAFSRDQLEHAANVIDNAKAIATAAIAKATL